ncbi:MAG: hypothetical protein JXQ71_06960 [Verrucomicrobia bacterium]|nr:hypothetical protein [Verrucomicrobiota bacterium]
MKVIRPNCRVQFTAEDLEFILSVLGPVGRQADSLWALLADEDSRDLILDNPQLFQAVLERRNCLRISTRFYFYILVRQVLRRNGIPDRHVADYVSELLAEFSQAENLRCRLPGAAQPLDYVVDLLAALQTADDTTTFHLRAHIGNHSLFMTGIFPDRIRHRVETRAAPGLSYYESVGRENYRLASDHRLARHYDLADVFSTLADRFQTTRQALNDLGDRLLMLGDPASPAYALLEAAWPPSPD